MGARKQYFDISVNDIVNPFDIETPLFIQKRWKNYK